MNVFFTFLLMFVGLFLLCWYWVNGIDDMNTNYPDYKGEDFLDFDEDQSS
jgi:hypothetical protein